jgi:hypothetical protein
MLDKIDIRRTVDYDKIISDSKTTGYVAEFIHKAGVLGQLREAEVTTAEPQEPLRSSITLGAEAEGDGYTETPSSAGQLSNIQIY